jgi:hypothetical protein
LRTLSSRKIQPDDVVKMIFRQLFDQVSCTYSYLLASRRGGEALIIDPVLEKVDRYLQLVCELDLKLVKAVDTHLRAVRALLEGRQPIELTPTRLLRVSKDLPHDWSEQRHFLGFADGRPIISGRNAL